MSDEIKEIDNSDLMELLETTSKKDFYRLTLDHELVVRLYNWITNLQKENEHLRTQVNTYENPDDMTLFYMWLDAKAKDKIKQLQKENTILKENAEHNDKVVDKARWNEMIYKLRNEKAIKYINNQICIYYVLDKKLNQLVDKTNIVKEDLLNILNGGDEE